MSFFVASTDTVQKKKGGEITLLPQKQNKLLIAIWSSLPFTAKEFNIISPEHWRPVSASPLGHIYISTPASPST